MLKYSIVSFLYFSVQFCISQAQVADIVLHLISIGSNSEMSNLTGSPAPCRSYVWTRLSAEIIVFSSSSWCSTTGYSTDGAPPNVNFGNGLDRNCSLMNTNLLDFHVSVAGLLSCDGNSEITWPLCTDSPPIAIDTSLVTNTATQQICNGSFVIKYSYTLKCRNTNSFPPTCTAVCYPHTNDPNTCYTCLTDGSKLCCNSSYGGANCSAGQTDGTALYSPTTTAYCPDSCIQVQPTSLQRTYFISMIFCACVAGILLIMVIILCVVCANHRSVIKMLRDYQNEVRPSTNETFRQASPRQYQQVRNPNPNQRRQSDYEDDERPAYYR